MIKAFVVAGVGVLAAIEFASPPRTADAVNQPINLQPAVSAVDRDAAETLTPKTQTSEPLTHETLTSADRTIPYAGGHIAPASEQLASTEPSAPRDTTAVVAPRSPKRTSRHRSEPTIKHVVDAASKFKPNRDDLKRADIGADRSKTVKNHEKNCHSTVIGDFLKTLNIPSGCNG